jgi:O-antigen ligase
MTQGFPLAVLTVLLMLLGSAVYTVAPGYAYPLILLAALVVIANPAFQNSVYHYVPLERLAGVFIFNAFFLIATFQTELDLRTRFVHLISLGVFLLTFTTTRLALEGMSNSRAKAEGTLRLAALATLIVLFCGQLAEVFGYIEPSDPGGIRDELSFWQRPGGFLNANMTAAVGLALIYIVCEVSTRRAKVLIAGSLAVFSMSLVLTQSRTGVLFFALYLLTLLFRGRLSYWFVLLLLIVLSLLAATYLGEPLFQLLMDNFVGRFQLDFSLSERVAVLARALDLVGDSPILGHGYRYVQHVMSVSTHNEILENAVNFGIAGSIVVWISFFLIYQPRSFSFLLACIAPSILFSHNFFETVSLQAILGVACVVSLMRDANRHPLVASVEGQRIFPAPFSGST